MVFNVTLVILKFQIIIIFRAARAAIDVSFAIETYILRK